MTEKELPKRRFALEEKDLAVEADENNKVAEDKENKFLKKIQEDATKDIQHLPTEKVLERLPDPTGWRILVLPFKGQGKTKGGVILTDQHMEERGYTTVTALVLKEISTWTMVQERRLDYIWSLFWIKVWDRRW